MDTLTSVEVGSRGNKGACFFPTLVLPVIKVTYVSSCSFVVHVYHKFPGVKFVASAKKLEHCPKIFSNGKINVNVDLFISFLLNTPFHTTVLLREKRRGYRGTTHFFVVKTNPLQRRTKLGAISRIERLRGGRADIVRQLGIQINLLLVYY